ncbi:MAG: hypothetical protein WCF08_10320, partial [Anaerolineaceae bacterium]
FHYYYGIRVMRPNNKLFWFILIVLSVLGGGLIAYATRGGLVLNPILPPITVLPGIWSMN